MKCLKHGLIVVLLFSTMQVSSMNIDEKAQELLRAAYHYTQVGAGIGIFLGGLYGLSYPLEAVYEHGYKPVKKKIIELTANRPWIRTAAKFTVPLICLTAGRKLIQNGCQS